MPELKWLATILAIAGQLLVIKKNILAFGLWNIANAIWIIDASHRQDWAQVSLFSFYIIINIYGIYTWQKK